MISHSCITRVTLAFLLTASPALRADPHLTSWLTRNSGRYARVVETNGGPLVTTWPGLGLRNMSGGQSLPAYADIQQIRYSSNFVYINGTGLASHQMGPWYSAVNQIFGNWPKNQNYLRRIPRQPQAAATKTVNGLGSIGLWVNGVSFFNLLDGFSYQNATGQELSGNPQGGGGGDNIWVRNAVAVESVTFDKSNAHQPGNGEYHYHNNPAALRLQLGDNIAYDALRDTYAEETSALHHSPILGWSYDGYPVYGPYGYADATHPALGVRRLVSGFVLRDGTRGTTDLRVTGRHTLASWSAALHSLPPTLSAPQYGPNVSASFPLGRYVEDHDYLGDLGGGQGVDFDLDVYNGRWGVTPEYPQGTYAYFVTLNSDGSSAFPYTIGRQYYGVASGGQVQTIPETVANYWQGGTNHSIVLESPSRSADGALQLQWSSIAGGTYAVDVSSNLTSWTALATDVASGGLATQFIESHSLAGNTAHRFYRVRLTSIAPFDATGDTTNGGGGSGITSVTPNGGRRNTTVSITITLNANVTPPLPPAQIVPDSVTIGALTGANITRNNTTVTAQFALPANASTGPQLVTVTFLGPGGSAGPSYTLANGFNIAP